MLTTPPKGTALEPIPVKHYLHHVAPALMSGEITEFFAQYR
ncbi:hypothetical protein ABIA39_005526 [Nocardia sp. GAS34]